MKQKLIFISPGPRMSTDSPEYERLSEYFTGDIITSSEIDEVLAAKKIAEFDFNCVKFEYKHRLISNIRFIAYCLKFALKSRFNSKRYDLVVTYDPLKTGLIGVIMARIIGAKFTPEVNGVYTSAAEYIDEKAGLATSIKKSVYPIIMRFVLKRADGIKLLFDSQITPFNKIIQGKIVERFPCYVDISRFKSDMIEEKVVLFVGFPFKRKGVDILIEAFKNNSSKYPDWKLKILGWFIDPTELNAAISGHPQIFHHEPVEYRDMPQHIGSCSILVLPSRSEAMGRVLVEAMAAGKARIGANVDGIPTVINDGVDGLLVEPENIEDLTEKLDLLMGDAELRRQIGENAKKRASEEFTEEVFFTNQINFYNRVLDGK